MKSVHALVGCTAAMDVIECERLKTHRVCISRDPAAIHRGGQLCMVAGRVLKHVAEHCHLGLHHRAAHTAVPGRPEVGLSGGHDALEVMRPSPCKPMCITYD